MTILRTFAALMPFAMLACGASDPAAAPPADAAVASDASDASAASDVLTQPAHALDAGADVAVTVSCDSLCDLVGASCTGAIAQYPSRAECIHECSDMPPGDYGDAFDTAGCRQAHAAAAAASPARECPLAGSFGGGACGDRCNSYCTLAIERCSGPSAIYRDKTTCDFQCGSRFAFDPHAAEYTESGNTLNCRMSYLKKALAAEAANADAGAPIECSLAGPDSTACR